MNNMNYQIRMRKQEEFYFGIANQQSYYDSIKEVMVFIQMIDLSDFSFNSK
ncbi:MAG: hypothetical protein ACRD5B_12570 [Nitrososphaeraceae archaeon]